MRRLLVPLALLPLLAASPARADDGSVERTVSVTRVSGSPLAAEAWTGVTAEAFVFRKGDENTAVPRDDVIEISTAVEPDPPRAHGPTDVLVDLRSGEAIAGRIVAGDVDGITVENVALGEVRIGIDAIAAVRFPQRLDQVADPPDLRSSPDADVVHLVGGDRITCQLESLGTDALACSTATTSGLRVAYARVLAVSLMDTSSPDAAEHALIAVLRDGTRVRGTDPQVEGGRLTLRSVSGFRASASLTDVVSVLVESDGFRYLSDLPAPEVDVAPFWEPVAGDADEIYAPRTDRSFSGGLLRAGGRTWLKGIGVFSGTTLRWKLDGAWKELRTAVAVDDGAGRLGAVVFVIEVDGEERWRSDLVVPAGGGASGRGTKGPVDAGRISLEGAQTLALKVLAGDAEDPYPIQDEADWLGAMLIR